MTSSKLQSCRALPKSIECQKARLKARKINVLFPEVHEVLNCLVYNYKLQRSALAEILKELNPKKPILDKDSLLNLGDKITGKIIECISTKPINNIEVKPDSSKHRGQFSEASGYVYCKVVAYY